MTYDSYEPARRSAHILLDALLATDVSREQEEPDGHVIILALLELEQTGAIVLIEDDEGQMKVDPLMLLAGTMSAMNGLLAGVHRLNPVTLEDVIATAREYIDSGTEDAERRHPLS